MTTRNEPPSPHDENLVRLDKIAAQVERARAALAKLEAEARVVVADALETCIDEGRSRTEVQQRSPFSPPVVRAIGEKAGIPADPRYARDVRGRRPEAVAED